MRKMKACAMMMTAALAFSLAAGAGVKPAEAKAKVVLDEDDGEVSLVVGKTATVSLLNVASKDVKKIKWSTSKKTVATVKAKKVCNAAAVITAVGAGNAKLTAKLAGKKYTCKITVAEEVPNTTAWISLHEKQADGTWKMKMTTPGYIGLNGLGKTKEGDAKTPVGEFKFNKAFGIADDPGCKIPYVKVDDDIYWSGDTNYHYNEMVNIKDYPQLNKEDSEHIIDYLYQYQYCLNVSYNEAGTPGLGSGIFVHCVGSCKPWTGGCISMPQDRMKCLMQNVDPEAVVLIDTYANLSGGADWPSSYWPEELEKGSDPINYESPEWVAKLPQAATAKQLFIVAAKC